jgi:hypothetical protein
MRYSTAALSVRRAARACAPVFSTSSLSRARCVELLHVQKAPPWRYSTVAAALRGAGGSSSAEAQAWHTRSSVTNLRHRTQHAKTQ